MRFQDSGLVNDKLVEQAFAYSQAYMQSLANEVLLNYRTSINKSYDRELELLKLDLRDKAITQDEYDREKADLEKQRAIDLKGPSPLVISATLERIFRGDALGTALEINNHSDKASLSLISTALLAACVRSPLDSKKVGKAFGEAIENIIATIVDVELYPAERVQKIAAANDDAKRLILAGLNNRFRQAAAKQELGEKITLQNGQAEELFKEVKLLWGVDKKLDARLVSVFNQAATVLKSTYTLEVGDKGLPQLVNNPAPPPPSKPLPKKPSFGDDGF